MSKHPYPQQTEWPEDAIFTLGHSTLPIERFLALLHTYGITALRTFARCHVRAITRNSTATRLAMR
jgi:hypothetical protein